MGDQRQSVRLAFLDFPGPYNPTRIEALLRQRFELVLDAARPDYVIHSCFGHEHLNHRNAVRILFLGENIHPDFNLCDYAFGYDWLDFGDRYYRCPNYQLYDSFRSLCRRRRSLAAGAPLPPKERFCNFIYTNRSSHPFRDDFFHRLGRYRKVDSAGRHLRNIEEGPGEPYAGDWWTPKLEFQRRYKFSIAFENSSTPGYTTEKIVQAMDADTIPIYWGNPEVGREFNSRRFVNCHDHPDPESVIERIRELDSNDDAFREVLQEPFFPDDRLPEGLTDEAILARFEHIFSQPRAEAYRRNLHGWGARYERDRNAASEALEFLESKGLTSRLARALRRTWRWTGRRES